MGTKVSDIGAAFWRNSRRTKTRENVQYVPTANGGGRIIGYGWAVYAVRSGSGKVTIYDGWYGYSATTSKHYGQLGLHRKGRGIRHVMSAPKVGGGRQTTNIPRAKRLLSR